MNTYIITIKNGAGVIMLEKVIVARNGGDAVMRVVKEDMLYLEDGDTIEIKESE